MSQSKSGPALQFPPLRSVQEFVGGNEWSKPTFNPKEFGALQKQIIENLVYYQSNYGAVAVPLLLLVAFFRPTAVILGLLVVAGLVAAYVYSTRQQIPATAVLNDRPIVVLALVLGVAFTVVKLFGTVFVFLVGIALPLALIVAHATVRTRSLQNKAANTAENLSLQATPMGLFLGWLGAKAAEETPSAPSTKRK